jgi:hypothetical protein
LASDDASFITGETLPVDGGRHAMCPRWNACWFILNNNSISKKVCLITGWNYIEVSLHEYLAGVQSL